MAEPLLLAKNATAVCELLPALANRHGLITGATGTGKTVTLQTLAENFSKIGVPVFMADVKGDLTGISQAGKIGDKMAGILKERGIDLPLSAACPALVRFIILIRPPIAGSIPASARRATPHSGPAAVAHPVGPGQHFRTQDVLQLCFGQ